MDQRLFDMIDESRMGTGYDVREGRREGELRKAMGFLNKVGKKILSWRSWKVEEGGQQKKIDKNPARRRTEKSWSPLRDFPIGIKDEGFLPFRPDVG